MLQFEKKKKENLKKRKRQCVACISVRKVKNKTHVAGSTLRTRSSSLCQWPHIVELSRSLEREKEERRWNASGSREPIKDKGRPSKNKTREAGCICMRKTYIDRMENKINFYK